MKRFKLWVLVAMLLLIGSATLVFGRGWLWLGTKWEPGGDFNWGIHADYHKFRADLSGLGHGLGLSKESKTAPKPGRPSEHK
jgi:hypothetical protein